MFRVATAPAHRRPTPVPAIRRAQRYPLVRRDPRRFARGISRISAIPEPELAEASNLRFFMHSFGGAFLFVSLLIA